MFSLFSLNCRLTARHSLKEKRLSIFVLPASRTRLMPRQDYFSTLSSPIPLKDELNFPNVPPF